MLDLAWNKMWMRKVRTLLTMLGVAVCVMLFVVITGVTDMTESNMENEVGKYLGQMYVRSRTVAGGAGQEFPPISSSIAEQTASEIISTTESINKEKSSAVLFSPLAPPPFPNAPPGALLIGVSRGKESIFLAQEEVKDGQATFASDRDIILGLWALAHFEGTLGGKIKTGDEIEILGEKFQVRGILKESETLFGLSMVLMPLNAAQETLNRQGNVSTVLLTAESLSDVPKVAENVRERFPKLEVMTQEEMAGNIDEALAGMRTFMGMINTTVLVVAAIVVLIVMAMAIMERTREIGILRALGAKRRTVLLTVLYESVMICLIGGVFGILFAWFLMVGVFGTSLATPAVIGQAIAVAFVVGIVASLYPAWRATRINPVEALRYE